MTRFALLGLLAACAATPAPAPSTLSPTVLVHANEVELNAGVAFADDKHVADVEVTFRGTTLHPQRSGEHSYGVNARFELDRVVANDEPITVTVDGIAMTILAPPPFDFVDVPQFISRSAPSTISWATTSADPIVWATQTSACTRGGGELAPGAASVTFTAADWKPLDSPVDIATCTTDIQFTRERIGTVDPAFGGGRIITDQSFDVIFASTP